jgi:pyruvate/2-oxoglutarate/acetoin dehydrogenase E1 component
MAQVANGEDVPEGDYVVPLGKARLAREGDDIPLVAYGAMVPLCERAADALADWKIEDAYMPSAERVIDACRRLLEL